MDQYQFDEAECFRLLADPRAPRAELDEAADAAEWWNHHTLAAALRDKARKL